MVQQFTRLGNLRSRALQSAGTILLNLIIRQYAKLHQLRCTVLYNAALVRNWEEAKGVSRDTFKM